mgnify:CR=1 FL=1
MNLVAIIGILIGVFIIVFRKKTRCLLETGIKKFPVYDKSVFNFTVKPINIVCIGAIFIFANLYFLLAQIL